MMNEAAAWTVTAISAAVAIWSAVFANAIIKSAEAKYDAELYVYKSAIELRNKACDCGGVRLIVRGKDE